METTTIASAPSVGAESVPAAPAESYTPSSAPSADAYVQMAQQYNQAQAAQPNVPDTDAAVPDAGVVPADASQQAQANPDETQPAAVTPEAEEQALREAFEAALPDDVKAVFKDKPWLRTAYYQARGMREVGWTLNGLRIAARAGLTEQSFGELNAMFPTLEDARRTSSLAASHQALQADFSNNPAAFVKGMFDADPVAARAVARTITGMLPQVDSESYVSTVAAGVNTLFNSIGAKIAGILKTDPESVAGQDLQTALRMIKNEVFPGSNEDGQAQQQHRVDPAIERELTELRGREQAYKQQASQQYQAEIYNRSVAGLEQYVDGLFKEANPSGFSEKGAQRIKQEAMQAIGQDFLSNPVVRADLDRMIKQNAPLDQVMQFVGNRLASLAPRRVAEVMRSYAQDFFVKPSAPQPRQPVPAPRDVGAVGGSVSPIATRGEFRPVAGIPYEEQMAKWLNG